MPTIDSTTPTNIQPYGFTGGYTLVMSDEFNTPTLDTKWDARRDFSDATLPTTYDIHANQNSALRMWWTGNTATDNILFSSTGPNPFRARYGFFEARVKCCSGRGFFPAFWLYPYSNSQVENNDGQQQELDITEWFSYENTDWLVDLTNFQCKNSKFTIWTEGGGGNTNEAGERKLSDFGGYHNDLSTAYHWYGMRWTPTGGLQYYFDGNAIGTAIADPWGSGNNIQLAVFMQLWWGPNGGNPTPDGNTPTTASDTTSLLFDYVRVWTVGGSPTPTPTPTPTPISLVDPATPTTAMPVGDTTGLYNLVFTDEFTGSTLNATKWANVLPGSTNATANYDTLGTNSLLRIWPEATFTERDINTFASYYLQYGYVELRAQMPTGTGVSPNFWLADSTYANSMDVSKFFMSDALDPKVQPFAQTSIWNTPIGSGAVFVAANFNGMPTDPASSANTANARVPGGDLEHIILSPASPQVTINYSSGGFGGNRCTVTGGTLNGLPLNNAPVPITYQQPSDGKNGCGAILMSDGRTVAMLACLTFCQSASNGTALAQYLPTQDIFGAGILGSHGGSGLSALGGAIRMGELRPGQTGMTHALKIDIYAHQFLYPGATRALCFRWPANTSDSYATNASTGYGRGSNATNTTNTAMKMGALLAIPGATNINTMGLVNEAAKQLAWTLQNYGAYIVDDTFGPGFNIAMEWGPAGDKRTEFAADFGFAFEQTQSANTSWVQDMNRLCLALRVVDNNTASTIGGGGTPRQPWFGSYGDGNQNPLGYQANIYAASVNSGTKKVVPGGNLNAAMHTYAMRWDATSIKFYFEGVVQTTFANPYSTTTPPRLSPIITLGYDGHPYGEAAGANSAPGATTPLGNTNPFSIDYLRIWTLATPTPTPPPPLYAELVSAPSNGTTINGVVTFQIQGDSIANAELLPGPTGVYTPVYGTFTLSAGPPGGFSVLGTLNWDTTGVANGSINVRISVFSMPPGQGGSEIVVTSFTYIINNVATLDQQFITSDLNAHPRTRRRRLRR